MPISRTRERKIRCLSWVQVPYHSICSNFIIVELCTELCYIGLCNGGTDFICIRVSVYSYSKLPRPPLIYSQVPYPQALMEIGISFLDRTCQTGSINLLLSQIFELSFRFAWQHSSKSEAMLENGRPPTMILPRHLLETSTPCEDVLSYTTTNRINRMIIHQSIYIQCVNRSNWMLSPQALTKA